MNMINEEILTEKLKYLVISAAGKKFEIESFTIDFEYDSLEHADVINEYDVNIKFEYQGVINGEVGDFGKDIYRMCYEFEKILNEWSISKEGKIQHNADVWVLEAMIWDIIYRVDETHSFNVTYKVNHR